MHDPTSVVPARLRWLAFACLCAALFLLALNGPGFAADAVEAEPRAVPGVEPPRPAASKPTVIGGDEVPAEEVVDSRLLAGQGPRARDVIVEAHLDDNLRHHLDRLASEVGQADGRLGVSDYVTVINGAALVEFVRDHGYRSFHGPVCIRRWPDGRIQVDVRITAKDRKTLVITLEADGKRQGVG